MPNSARLDGPDRRESPQAAWRREYPFASHWSAQPMGRLHYIDEGPPEGGRGTLLFVHGNPTWSFHWRRLVAELRGQYRCVALDHLGCGLSDRAPRPLDLEQRIEQLTAFVETLDLQRITLVAQDWGGAIGLGAMQRMPGRLERIALFNTGAFTPRSIPWRIGVCRWPLVGRLAVQGAGLFSRAALRMTLARLTRLPSHVADGYLAPYDSWQSRAAVYQFVRDIPADERHPTWRTLQQIEARLGDFVSVPILLVWGMRDWCFTPESLARFVDAWPHAEIHRLADVGHWVVEDAAADALHFLSNFLKAPVRELRASTHE